MAATLPDDLVSRRNDLYNVSYPMEYTPEEFQRYWPFVSNVWLVKERSATMEGDKMTHCCCRSHLEAAPDREKIINPALQKRKPHEQDCDAAMEVTHYVDGQGVSFRPLRPHGENCSLARMDERMVNLGLRAIIESLLVTCNGDIPEVLKVLTSPEHKAKFDIAGGLSIDYGRIRHAGGRNSTNESRRAPASAEMVDVADAAKRWRTAEGREAVLAAARTRGVPAGDLRRRTAAMEAVLKARAETLQGVLAEIFAKFPEASNLASWLLKNQNPNPVVPAIDEDSLFVPVEEVPKDVPDATRPSALPKSGPSEEVAQVVTHYQTPNYHVPSLDPPTSGQPETASLVQDEQTPTVPLTGDEEPPKKRAKSTKAKAAKPKAAHDPNRVNTWAPSNSVQHYVGDMRIAWAPDKVVQVPTNVHHFTGDINNISRAAGPQGPLLSPATQLPQYHTVQPQNQQSISPGLDAVPPASRYRAAYTDLGCWELDPARTQFERLSEQTPRPAPSRYVPRFAEPFDPAQGSAPPHPSLLPSGVPAGYAISPPPPSALEWAHSAPPWGTELPAPGKAISSDERRHPVNDDAIKAELDKELEYEEYVKMFHGRVAT